MIRRRCSTGPSLAIVLHFANKLRVRSDRQYLIQGKHPFYQNRIWNSINPANLSTQGARYITLVISATIVTPFVLPEASHPA